MDRLRRSPAVPCPGTPAPEKNPDVPLWPTGALGCRCWPRLVLPPAQSGTELQPDRAGEIGFRPGPERGEIPLLGLGARGKRDSRAEAALRPRRKVIQAS